MLIKDQSIIYQEIVITVGIFIFIASIHFMKKENNMLSVSVIGCEKVHNNQFKLECFVCLWNWMGWGVQGGKS